jgi:glycosyltransferase involved in cell wall biosynthesis
MTIPRLSIGVPVYNGQDYLRFALDSIVRQDYTDFELIISDNASTDATQEICRGYAAKDGRIRYYRNATNIGASGNYNRVFELARGAFFKWAAHDDVHLPGCLKRCVEVFDQAPPNVALVAPASEIIDEHGNTTVISVECLDTRYPRAHQRLANVLERVFWAPAQFGLFRSETLRKTRLIDPFFASDNVLLAEIAMLGEIWEIPEVLFQRRLHPGVSTNVNRNWRELQVWFAPSQRGLKRFIPPPIRLGLEFMQSIARMPLPARERLLCYKAVFCVWYPRQGRRFVQDCRNKIAIRTRMKKALGRVAE